MAPLFWFAPRSRTALILLAIDNRPCAAADPVLRLDRFYAWWRSGLCEVAAKQHQATESVKQLSDVRGLALRIEGILERFEVG